MPPLHLYQLRSNSEQAQVKISQANLLIEGHLKRSVRLFSFIEIAVLNTRGMKKVFIWIRDA